MALAPLTLADIGNRPVIGIDPGATGGIAWIDNNGMSAMKMPEERLACQHMYTLAEAFAPFRPVVFIEKVFIKAGQASMVSYVSRYGGLIGALFAHKTANVEIYEIAPQDWQACYPELASRLDNPRMGRQRAEAAELRRKRRAEIKQFSRDTASALYPALAPLMRNKNSDGISDAILLCLYGAHCLKSKN